jgi:hypothetical protein
MEVLWGVVNESHGTKIYDIYLALVSRTVLASMPWSSVMDETREVASEGVPLSWRRVSRSWWMCYWTMHTMNSRKAECRVALPRLSDGVPGPLRAAWPGCQTLLLVSWCPFTYVYSFTYQRRMHQAMVLDLPLYWATVAPSTLPLASCQRW